MGRVVFVRRCQAPRGTSQMGFCIKAPLTATTSRLTYGAIGMAGQPVHGPWGLFDSARLYAVHGSSGDGPGLQNQGRPGFDSSGTCAVVAQWQSTCLPNRLCQFDSDQPFFDITNSVPGAQVRSSSPYKRVPERECRCESCPRLSCRGGGTVDTPTKAGPTFPRAHARVKTGN